MVKVLRKPGFYCACVVSIMDTCFESRSWVEYSRLYNATVIKLHDFVVDFRKPVSMNHDELISIRKYYKIAIKCYKIVIPCFFKQQHASKRQR